MSRIETTSSLATRLHKPHRGYGLQPSWVMVLLINCGVRVSREVTARPRSATIPRVAKAPRS
jgi:hypothetical protein